MKIKTKPTAERTGELYVIAETIIYALFPILVAHTTRLLPPILFAALSTLAAALSLLVYVLVKKQFSYLKNKQFVKYILGVTLFVVILPSILIFTGSSQTSGINTTILLQSEIFFTFLFFGFFSDERITMRRALGALIMICGTLLILFQGTSEINTGDLLIIAGTLFYPLGNMFAKKALKLGPPGIILFVRALIGGSALLILSLIFEQPTPSPSQILVQWPFILTNGVLIYALSKLLWYEGLKRIDVSKAIAMSTGTFPALSLILAVVFLHEIPSAYQLSGLVIVVAGAYILLSKAQKVAPLEPV